MYKSFYNMHIKKRKCEKGNGSSERLKTNNNNEKENRLFPNYWMIYVSIKVGGKKKFAKIILTHNEDSHVKEASWERNDEKMVMDISGKE